MKASEGIPAPSPTQHGALGWFDGCTEQKRPKPGLTPLIPVQGAPEGQEGAGTGVQQV